MDKHNEHLQTLSDIRSIMERSTRFISLSGLSGVAAGIFALIGAAMVYLYLDITPFDNKTVYYEMAQTSSKWGLNYFSFFLLDALAVLFLAILSGIYFTTQKARSKGHKIWDSTSRRVIINMLIPLVAGGIFCLILVHHGLLALVAPSTLCFYGLALLNASKYTLDDIRYLGITEIVLGLIAAYFLGYGLEFWAIGFGIMHILYGTFMWWKYER